MKINYIFERIEKKYLLNEEKYQALLKVLLKYMQEDEYGLTTICNIYFDTENNDLIRKSIDKPKYKEKLRLRSYGVPKDEDRVFIEIKKKYDGVVYKRRVSMNLKEANEYLDYGIKPNKTNQIMKEIEYFISYHKPKPKLFLAYDRVAYYGKEDSNLRVTVDRNIRSRDYDLDLSKGDYGDRLLDNDMYIMEIKIPMAMPMWLTKELTRLQIFPTSFSKYGNIYKKNLINKKEEIECLQV